LEYDGPVAAVAGPHYYIIYIFDEIIMTFKTVAFLIVAFLGASPTALTVFAVSNKSCLFKYIIKYFSSSAV